MSMISLEAAFGRTGTRFPRQPLAWLWGRVRAHLARLRAGIDRARAEHALLRLDDRMLRDIGLDRGAVRHVVEHGRGRQRGQG